MKRPEQNMLDALSNLTYEFKVLVTQGKYEEACKMCQGIDYIINSLNLLYPKEGEK